MERSKSGNFSFWLGKHHVVGLTGEGPRKLFLDNRNLDRISAARLHGVGPESTPPIHPIFQAAHKGHNYFQRRVLDLMKTEYLTKRLPLVIADARAAFESMAKDPSAITNPTEACYRLVLAQSCRIVCADEITDTPELLDSYLRYTKILAHCASGHTTAHPWLPSWSRIKRAYCRYGLYSIVAPIVIRRMKKGAPRGEDALQVLIDSGDSADEIITFFISILFISVANAGKLAGLQLNMVAHRTYWQEKMYAEVKAAAAAHAKNNKPLVEQLDSIPLEAWDASFPSIDICLREAIRLHVHFPMTRRNVSRNPLPIPGTDEVIPSGSFVAYFTSDAHFNEEMYPNPQEYDPERYLEGRPEVERQTYSCEYPAFFLPFWRLRLESECSVVNYFPSLLFGLFPSFLDFAKAMTDWLVNSPGLGRGPTPLRRPAMGQIAA